MEGAGMEAAVLFVTSCLALFVYLRPDALLLKIVSTPSHTVNVSPPG